LNCDHVFTRFSATKADFRSDLLGSSVAVPVVPMLVVHETRRLVLFDLIVVLAVVGMLIPGNIFAYSAG
jgi:hypothetical protein